MAAYLTRPTRPVVLEPLREDFVRTARQGPSERFIPLQAFCATLIDRHLPGYVIIAID